MFDLFRSRDKLVRYMLGGLLLIVAASMITYLIPGFNTNTGTPAAAVFEIGDTHYTVQEVQQGFQRFVQGQHMTPENADIYFPQFVDNMVQARAAVYEANQLGLTVSDDEVLAKMIASNPQFFPNGVLNKPEFEAFLAQQGATVQEAIDDLRGQLTLTKLQDALLGSVIVSPKEVEDEFVHKYQKAKVQYIAFPVAKFRDQIKLTDDEVRAEWARTQAQHQVPTKYSYQVLVIEQDKVQAAIQVTDAQLRSAYSASMDNYRSPDRVHVRHILIKADGTGEAEKKARAEGLLKQLKAGADFAELAKKNSEDGSAQNGGDLGFMAHGQTVPEFDATIFKLQPKEISGVVKTQFGYHIIQVLEKETAHVKPLEEVKASLTEDLKKQNIAEKMQSLAEQVHTELVKNPSGAAEIAKQLGVDLVTVPKGSVNQAIPTLGVAPEISTLLVGMKKGDVSQVVVLPANREAVFVVQDVFPAHVAEFEDVKADVRDSLIQQQLGQLTIKKSNEAAAELRKGEDINKVAKSMGLEVTTSSDFARTDAVEGLGEAQYLSDAFTAPVGTILGPTLIQGRWVVTKLISRTAADLSALSAERDSLLHELKRKKATDVNEMLMDSIVAKLESEGKVKVHRDEIQRMLANFRK